MYTVTYNVHVLLEVTKHFVCILARKLPLTARGQAIAPNARECTIWFRMTLNLKVNSEKCNNYFNNLRISRPRKCTERYQDQFDSMNTTIDLINHAKFRLFPNDVDHSMTSPRHEDVLRRWAKEIPSMFKNHINPFVPSVPKWGQ